MQLHDVVTVEHITHSIEAQVHDIYGNRIAQSYCVPPIKSHSISLEQVVHTSHVV